MKERATLFFRKYIAPKAKNDDFARREFILNILLVASISLIIFGTFIHTFVLVFQIFDLESYRNNTLSLGVEIAILIFFILLYFLSRKGFFCLASYFLLAVFFLLATYMGYKWGVDLPAEIAFYVIVIVMAGILINTRFAFFVTFLICATIAVIGYMQTMNILMFNRYWASETWKASDIVAASAFFFVIATVSWLSNREIEKSLERARKSEAELKKERDSLEIKVEKRTAELKKAQTEQVSQLYRFAEFGKLSSGLFHDLVNPLTAASLNMEMIKNAHNLEIEEATSHFNKAASAIKRMENFIVAVKKQMIKEKTESFFSLVDEIHSVIQILEYKAKKANVEINFLPAEKIMTYGDCTKFNQIVLNLIANAVDSYAGMNDIGKERKVQIGILLKDGIIYLTVQDWGCGIAPEVKDKIFQPFFTSKEIDAGTGIGLSLTKRIVENDFGGAIEFKSEKNKGATFIVSFPVVAK